ncbi:Tol-Pal system subunit TolQ [Thalassobaculum fulvum]|uniref:Tol-Pal system protein TolQ n=1 Tax=Thalassobaculum fulvum TaxID=1633335 RepID=A0A918XYS3_9PROT|nr:protein TolQ [Thalassobaculum fulvum]GHD63497.1 Tol-Pal system subunit TolQ [Thalassobaculum fulvum]
MDQTAQIALGTAAAEVSTLSIWDLFLAADPIVKGVMFMLLIASVICWAIIFDKTFKMRSLRRRASDFEEAFWSGGSLEDLYDRMGNHPEDPMSAVFASAMREWRRSAARGLTAKGNEIRASLRQRIDQVMALTVSREMEALEKRMTFLASVGSTAPFIGLFGTVWGIMNSFQSIAASKNTSLAVVAPGIAEALFATALGLVAAIPAVIFYNKISSDLGKYAARLEGFASEFGSILSRQLDEGQ